MDNQQDFNLDDMDLFDDHDFQPGQVQQPPQNAVQNQFQLLEAEVLEFDLIHRQNDESNTKAMVTEMMRLLDYLYDVTNMQKLLEKSLATARPPFFIKLDVSRMSGGYELRNSIKTDLQAAVVTTKLELTRKIHVLVSRKCQEINQKLQNKKRAHLEKLAEKPDEEKREYLQKVRDYQRTLATRITQQRSSYTPIAHRKPKTNIFEIWGLPNQKGLLGPGA